MINKLNYKALLTANQKYIDGQIKIIDQIRKDFLKELQGLRAGNWQLEFDEAGYMDACVRFTEVRKSCLITATINLNEIEDSEIYLEIDGEKVIESDLRSFHKEFKLWKMDNFK